MKHTKTPIKYILNLCSYIMISLSLFLIISSNIRPKHILNLTFLFQDNQIIILHHKNYKTLSKNDIIYYYQETNKIEKETLQQISPAKYQIHLKNGSYITPSHYIGIELCTFPFSISISKINNILFLVLLFPLSLLLLVIKTKNLPSNKVMH